MEYALYNGNKISATAVAEDYNFEKSVRIAGSSKNFCVQIRIVIADF